MNRRDFLNLAILPMPATVQVPSSKAFFAAGLQSGKSNYTILKMLKEYLLLSALLSRAEEYFREAKVGKWINVYGRQG